VLSLAVSALLFERFSGSDEGDLTRVRAHLVREDSLHRAALSLGLPEVLRLSEGEARGRRRAASVDPGRRGRSLDRGRLRRWWLRAGATAWCAACSAN
jgi:dsRNA-specific ribonuclease